MKPIQLYVLDDHGRNQADGWKVIIYTDQTEMGEEQLKQLHIKVSGRVQGVMFRDNAKKAAEHASLVGFVCNLGDCEGCA